MKTFKEWLRMLPHNSHTHYFENINILFENMSIEEAVQHCNRGDWLLFIAQVVEVDIIPLTLTKGLCANTVKDFIKNERSIEAIDAAISFGIREIDEEKLKTFGKNVYEEFIKDVGGRTTDQKELIVLLNILNPLPE